MHRQEGLYTHVSVGNVGDHQTSVEHLRYVTRADKTFERPELLILHNVPDEIRELRNDYLPLREGLLKLSAEHSKREFKYPHRGRGKRRMFYRVESSFGEQVEDALAVKWGEEFLRAAFPRAVAVGAVHKDTPHWHIHYHLEARETDQKKIQLSYRDYRQIDERWAQIYRREFGEKKFLEYLAKKAETMALKKEYFAAMRAIEDRTGLDDLERENLKEQVRQSFRDRWPERVRVPAERRREIERRSYDPGRVRDDQRAPDRRESTLERTVELADRALREVMRLSERGERIFRQERERFR